jgi:hypothetical protein
MLMKRHRPVCSKFPDFHLQTEILWREKLAKRFRQGPCWWKDIVSIKHIKSKKAGTKRSQRNNKLSAKVHSEPMMVAEHRGSALNILTYKWPQLRGTSHICFSFTRGKTNTLISTCRTYQHGEFVSYFTWLAVLFFAASRDNTMSVCDLATPLESNFAEMEDVSMYGEIWYGVRITLKS